MIDVVDAATRSKMMANISGKDTRPELLVRKSLYAAGYRYRLHRRNLPGRPDIVLAKYRAVIFVNGCFWHGHDCRLFKIPKTRPNFWLGKIDDTRQRDKNNRQSLLLQNWRVLTVWECALKGRGGIGLDQVLEQIISWINSDLAHFEIRGRR